MKFTFNLNNRSSTMKSSFHKFTAALLAACLFTLFACSGDGEGNEPSEQNSHLFCEISDFYGYDCGEITEAEIGLCREYGGKLVNSCRTPSSSSSHSIIYGPGPTVSHGGEDYQTVVIGNQTWFARNLNYNHYKGSECYNNEPANCSKYGRLYDWQTATSVGVCPSGWNLPTDAQWTTLINYIGGESNAGKKLKARSGWNNSGNGTDDYGFSALPGGSKLPGGSFTSVGSEGHWWSYDDLFLNPDYAYSSYMDNYGLRTSNFTSKRELLSIRCIKGN